MKRASLLISLSLLPNAIAATPDFLRDVPALASRISEADTTEVSGVPVRTRTCVSRQTPLYLKQHFTEAFLKAGLYLSKEAMAMQMAKGEQVTGLDVDTRISYTVLLQPGARGTTIVLGEAFLGSKPATPKDSFAPVFPGAGPVTTATFESVRTLSYPVRASPERVREFYRSRLLQAGYKEEAPMVFVSSSQRLTIHVSASGQEQAVFLVAQPIGRAPELVP